MCLCLDAAIRDDFMCLCLEAGIRGELKVDYPNHLRCTYRSNVRKMSQVHWHYTATEWLSDAISPLYSTSDALTRIPLPDEFEGVEYLGDQWIRITRCTAFWHCHDGQPGRPSKESAGEGGAGEAAPKTAGGEGGEGPGAVQPAGQVPECAPSSPWHGGRSTS